MKLIVGTRNAKKVVEIVRVLAGVKGVEAAHWPSGMEMPEVVEDRQTFLGNARKKALELSKLVADPVLADDSGLEVEGLGGEPGVRSHRYAGEPPDDERNNRKLLRMLEEVSDGKRTARFRCALVVAREGRELFHCVGSCRGEIAREPRGEYDFGYDPLFYCPEYGRTFAELTPQEKDRVSHRGEALRKLKEWLKKQYGSEVHS